ncbi:MAG: hypothetical protein ACI8Z1_000945, partial [Candidatus Azotimanducaceae bacterium]
LLIAALDAVFRLLGPAVARLHLGGPTAWGIISAGAGFGTLIGACSRFVYALNAPCSLQVVLVSLSPLMP